MKRLYEVLSCLGVPLCVVEAVSEYNAVDVAKTLGHKAAMAFEVERNMTTIYVFDNELLGDNGDQFAAALIDQYTGDTQSECEAWFAKNYNPNDYTSSYTAP